MISSGLQFDNGGSRDLCECFLGLAMEFADLFEDFEVSNTFVLKHLPPNKIFSDDLDATPTLQNQTKSLDPPPQKKTKNVCQL